MRTLARFEPLIARGGIPQISCRPLFIELNLRAPLMFITFPCIQQSIFNRPFEVQKGHYTDPGFRQQIRNECEKSGLHHIIFSQHLERIEVLQGFNPALKHLEGKTLADIARERGAADGLDCCSTWRWKTTWT